LARCATHGEPKVVLVFPWDQARTNESPATQSSINAPQLTDQEHGSAVNVDMAELRVVYNAVL
jgi:hypothetical protein